MKHEKNNAISLRIVALCMIAYGIYAFVLSLIGGVIVWICLGLGLSYEVSIAAVLAFFLAELATFFSAKRSPAVKATNALLRPIVFIARHVVARWACMLSRDIKRDVTRQLVKGTCKLWDTNS